MTNSETTIELQAEKTAIILLIRRLYHELKSVELSHSKINTDLLYGLDEKAYIFNLFKYINQAQNYLEIGILKLEGKPVPDFLVSLSDLSCELVGELSQLSSIRSHYVLKETVWQIFEDRLHNSYPDLKAEVKSALKVRFVD